MTLVDYVVDGPFGHCMQVYQLDGVRFADSVTVGAIALDARTVDAERHELRENKTFSARCE